MRMVSQSPPAIASNYYPEDREALKQLLATLINEASYHTIRPKALIVPHAPYDQAGNIAATAFSLLHPYRHQIKKVVLLGHSHSLNFDGILLPSYKSLNTPLGLVSLDQTLLQQAYTHAEINLLTAYRPETSLEVPLPFLQYCLDTFSLLPLLIGNISALSVAQIINTLWGTDETLFIISTDLSYHHSYAEAEARDAATINAIEQLSTHLTSGQTCGYAALNGLLKIAQQKGLKIITLERGSSADSLCAPNYVTGHAAFVLQ